LTVPASGNFITELDKNLSAVGYSNRSQFIRDALIEKMARAGVEIPKELALAPDRSGKGGPAPKLLKIPATTNSNVKAEAEARIASAKRIIRIRSKSHPK